MYVYSFLSFGSHFEPKDKNPTKYNDSVIDRITQGTGINID